MTKDELILYLSEKSFEFEEKRMEKLNTKSEKIIAAVLLVFTIKLVDVPVLTLNIVSITGFAILVISLLSAFSNLLIAKYKGYPRDKAIMEKFNSPQITVLDINYNLSRVLLDAKEINAKINDGRAKYIMVSSISLILGFVLLVINLFV